MSIKYKRLEPNGTSREYAVSYLTVDSVSIRLNDNRAYELYRQLAEVWGNEFRSDAGEVGNDGECN